MPVVAADIRIALQIAATLLAALLVIATLQISPLRAQTSHMLVIPASDGYGFDDCLAGNKPCGHVIADAWCEAHGMVSAMSFGRSDDITASIGSTHPAAVQPGSYVVNCKD